MPETDDHETALVAAYGQKAAAALHEMLRLTDTAARLVARGRGWYDGDPDHVPGLASESLIVKVGENVSRLPAELLDAHREVPWRVIKDMRNRLSHYYEATDYEVVWETLRRDLPSLAVQLRLILEGEVGG